MQTQFTIVVPDNLEESLFLLGEINYFPVFSAPVILEEGKTEMGYSLTGKTSVTLTASGDDEANKLKELLLIWLKENDIPFSAMTSEKYAENKNWMENFKEFFKPIEIADKIVVRPTWEPPLPAENKPGATIILIEPGMAFGTGTHETTKLCLELMSETDFSGKTLYDLGAGSGILSFYALKNGAKEAIAIEIEEEAVENLKENAALNKIPEDKFLPVCADLANFKPEKPADVLLANIDSPTILKNLNFFPSYLKKGGLAFFSGIGMRLAEEVKQGLQNNGWELLEERLMNDWRALLARLKKTSDK
ncbi:MAG: methyltransferase [Candidatus Riflebacteria bacterium]|nr:methyltransferase [Candidatus Riflebacteria bacterium]